MRSDSERDSERAVSRYETRIFKVWQVLAVLKGTKKSLQCSRNSWGKVLLGVWADSTFWVQFNLLLPYPMACILSQGRGNLLFSHAPCPTDLQCTLEYSTRHKRKDVASGLTFENRFYTSLLRMYYVERR